MRISIQACIERAGEQPSKVIEVAVIERNADVAPASGLGLFIRESQEILRQLQTVVLTEKVDQFIRITGRCQLCGGRLGIKDTKSLVYRTAFGKARLRSPRFYSYCSACGYCSSNKGTLSPLGTGVTGTRTSPVDLAAVPICKRDVLSLGTDLSTRHVCRRTGTPMLER
jgi:hypothetical protein